MKIKDLLTLLAKNKLLLVAFLIIFSFVIYNYIVSVKNDYYLPDAPLGIAQVPEVGEVVDRITLEQGDSWNQEQRELYWFTSQGSEVIPYDWFVWLEQAENNSLFRSADFMEKVGYLPSKSSAKNPGGLPIGFTPQRPRKDRMPYMGLNCAACHTNQINYKDKKLMIEGAPTLANFETLYTSLINAVKATKNDSDKFKRFADKILPSGYSTDDTSDLKNQMNRWIGQAQDRQIVNALPSPEFPQDFAGHGRVDAFGQIANSGTALALNKLSNNNPPSAPVSYPFLWGTHQSDVVQWNASAPNIPIVGPLVRNVGEVVGVFGNLSIHESPWWQQLLGIDVAYSSTVDYKGIGEIETWIKELKSPQWPQDIFPKLDENKLMQGAILYDRECSSCHQVIKRVDEFKDYTSKKVPLAQVGTDPIMAYNAGRGMANTLILEGINKDLVTGGKFGATAGATSIVVNGILGVILKRPKKALEAGKAPDATGDHKDQLSEYLKLLLKEKLDDKKEYKHPNDTIIAPNALGPNGPVLNLDSLVYKARPLNGIWATAPYLHNGSVPNLWELLQAPNERITTFKVGNREFDPVNVGFQYDEGPSTFNVMRSDSTIMPGNSNLGHNYGTGLTDDEKWAVIEYMKSL